MPPAAAVQSRAAGVAARAVPGQAAGWPLPGPSGGRLTEPDSDSVLGCSYSTTAAVVRAARVHWHHNDSRRGPGPLAAARHYRGPGDRASHCARRGTANSNAAASSTPSPNPARRAAGPSPARARAAGPAAQGGCASLTRSHGDHLARYRRPPPGRAAASQLPGPNPGLVPGPSPVARAGPGAAGAAVGSGCRRRRRRGPGGSQLPAESSSDELTQSLVGMVPSLPLGILLELQSSETAGTRGPWWSR